MKYEDKPKTLGYYWVKNWLSSKPAKIVKVWGYKSVKGDQLFTNEDGGASIDDDMYLHCKWYGPLEEPGVL